MKLHLTLITLMILLLVSAATHQQQTGRGVNDPRISGRRTPTTPPASGQVHLRPSPTPFPTRASRSQHRRTLLNWHALAQCESSSNPTAVSPTGRYRGAFQMDRNFWRTYGGLHYATRPDQATYSQQLHVAQAGYTARGRQPWPHCGRRL